MPASTSRGKIEPIEWQGGRCRLVDDPVTIYEEARRLAAETGGHSLDQFTHGERATAWRGDNNIAESIIEQLAQEVDPENSAFFDAWASCGPSVTVPSGGRSSRIEGIGRPRVEPSSTPRSWAR